MISVTANTSPELSRALNKSDGLRCVLRLADVVRVAVVAEREDRRRGESVREEEAGKDDWSSLPSDKHHLGLFTDRKGTYLCLQQECEFPGVSYVSSVSLC